MATNTLKGRCVAQSIHHPEYALAELEGGGWVVYLPLPDGADGLADIVVDDDGSEVAGLALCSTSTPARFEWICTLLASDLREWVARGWGL